MTTSTVYQTASPATMPPGLEVDAEAISGAVRQAVAVHNPQAGTPLDVAITSSSLPTGAATAANQTTEIAQLQSINFISTAIYDTVLITYTDATKATISKIEWKLAAAVVRTFTPTFGSTTDTWVKS